MGKIFGALVFRKQNRDIVTREAGGQQVVDAPLCLISSLVNTKRRSVGRVCAIRKSEHGIQQAHRRLQRKASKKQTTLKPETLEYAKYVIVFTTLAAESAGEVLECYRLRWQIELTFKRMKTLAQLGHLPKHDDRSARAWPYGKLLVALLTQKLIRVGRDISPWGYSLLGPSTDESLA